jgi:hypothetical protein
LAQDLNVSNTLINLTLTSYMVCIDLARVSPAIDLSPRYSKASRQHLWAISQTLLVGAQHMLVQTKSMCTFGSMLTTSYSLFHYLYCCKHRTCFTKQLCCTLRAQMHSEHWQ